MNSSDAFISSKKLAELCGVSLRTVEGWRRRKQGPLYEKRLNRTVRYPLATAIAYAEEYSGRSIARERYE
ncbi:hypothetical protein [Desulfovibrio falkowii]|uniref:Helix-turn-helix domain-containing protein n=1 Tax=Desulfovibrio falkowii TaxID=3136602 RepID=A0ABQ0E839_9BACT